MADLIDRQAALNIRVSEGLYEDGVIFVPLRDVTEGIKALPPVQPEMTDEQFKDYCRKRCLSVVTNEFMEDVRKMMPAARPDEKLEKCRFEYINACRVVTYPTQDTTKKDISDAYAVIKVLQPIFGDVTF